MRPQRIALVLALMFALPCAAQAQSSVTASPAQGPPGTKVTLTGAQWDPYWFPAPIEFWEVANGTVLYEADNLGSATSSNPGCAPTVDPDTGALCDFSVQVTVPAGAPTDVTGELVDGAFPIAEMFVVAPADQDCCTAASFDVTSAPAPEPTRAKPIPARALRTLSGILLTLAGDWNAYCTVRPASSACTPWKNRAVARVFDWLDKLGKVIAVIDTAKVLGPEVLVGHDLAVLSNDCQHSRCPLKHYKRWPASAKRALSALYGAVNALRQAVIDMVDSFSPVPLAVPAFFDRYFPIAPCRVCGT